MSSGDIETEVSCYVVSRQLLTTGSISRQWHQRDLNAAILCPA